MLKKILKTTVLSIIIMLLSAGVAGAALNTTLFAAYWDLPSSWTSMPAGINYYNTSSISQNPTYFENIMLGIINAGGNITIGGGTGGSVTASVMYDVVSHAQNNGGSITVVAGANRQQTAQMLNTYSQGKTPTFSSSTPQPGGNFNYTTTKPYTGSVGTYYATHTATNIPGAGNYQDGFLTYNFPSPPATPAPPPSVTPANPTNPPAPTPAPVVTPPPPPPPPPLPDISGTINPTQGHPGEAFQLSVSWDSNTSSGFAIDSMNNNLNFTSPGVYTYTIPATAKIGQIINITLFGVNQWYPGGIQGDTLKVVVVNNLTLTATANPTTLAPTEQSQITAQTQGYANSVVGQGQWVYDPKTPNKLVASGKYHTIAVTTGGTVEAWGNNYDGQLGDGTLDTRVLPVQVKNISNAISVAAGQFFSMALTNTGTVYAWGNNTYGQLGNGTYTSNNIPVQVKGLQNIVAIAAGYNSGYAIKADGTAWAWGDNANGELGNGSTTNSDVPVEVKGITSAVNIAGGNGFATACDTSGNVWSWGINTSGQLGDGTTNQRNTRVQMQNATNIGDVAAGDSHILLRKNDGTVWAVGNNKFGQLGNGTTTNSSTPVQCQGLSGILNIAANGFYSSALGSGLVYTWGENDSFQLGYLTDSQTTPKQVTGIAPVIFIADGENFTSTVTNSSTIQDWGDNIGGQLGVGEESVPKLSPSTVSYITNSSPEATLIGTNIILTDNSQAIYADQHDNQVYNNGGINSTTLTGTPVIKTSSNGSTTVGLGINGYLYSYSGGTLTALPYLADVKDVTVGYNIELIDYTGRKTLAGDPSTLTYPYYGFGTMADTGFNGLTLASEATTVYAIKNDGTLWQYAPGVTAGWSELPTPKKVVELGSGAYSFMEYGSKRNYYDTTIDTYVLNDDGTVGGIGGYFSDYGYWFPAFSYYNYEDIALQNVSKLAVSASGLNIYYLDTNNIPYAWGVTVGLVNGTYGYNNYQPTWYASPLECVNQLIWNPYTNTSILENVESKQLQVGGTYQTVRDIFTCGNITSKLISKTGQVYTNTSEAGATDYPIGFINPNYSLYSSGYSLNTASEQNLGNLTKGPISTIPFNTPSTTQATATWTGLATVPIDAPIGSQYIVTITAKSPWQTADGSQQTATTYVILQVQNVLELYNQASDKYTVNPGDTINITVDSKNYVMAVQASGPNPSGGNLITANLNPATSTATIPKDNSWSSSFTIPTNAKTGAYVITLQGTNSTFSDQAPSTPVYLNITVGTPPVEIVGQPTVTPDPVYSHRDGQNMVTVSAKTQGLIGRVTLSVSGQTEINNIVSSYSVALPDMVSMDGTNWTETYQVPDNMPDGTPLVFTLNAIAQNGSFTYGPVYTDTTVDRYLIVDGSASPTTVIPGQAVSLNGTTTNGHASSVMVSDGMGTFLNLTTTDPTLQANTWTGTYNVPATARIGQTISLTWTPTDKNNGTSFTGESDYKSLIVANTPAIQSVLFNQVTPYVGADTGAPTATMEAVVITTGYISSVTPTSWTADGQIQAISMPADTSYIALDNNGTRQFTIEGLKVPEDADVSNKLPTTLNLSASTNFLTLSGAVQTVTGSGLLTIDNKIVATAQQLSNPVVTPGTPFTVTVSTTGFAAQAYAVNMNGSVLALTPTSPISSTSIPYSNTWTGSYTVPVGTASGLYNIPVYATNTYFTNQTPSNYDYIYINVGGVPSVISAWLSPYVINLPAANTSDQTVNLYCKTTGAVKGVQVRLSVNGGSPTILPTDTFNSVYTAPAITSGTPPNITIWQGSYVVDPNTPNNTHLAFTFQAIDSSGNTTGPSITPQDVIVYSAKPPLVVVTH